MKRGSICEREFLGFLERVGVRHDSVPDESLALFFAEGFNRAAALIQDQTCGCGSFANIGFEEAPTDRRTDEKRS